MRKFSAYSLIFILIVTLLTNGIGISFKPEVFAHELDHVRQALSLNLETHLEAHRNSIFMEDMELDAATHLCLHAAGQYQPFYFIRITMIPPLEGKTSPIPHILLSLPDSILESPYHPPRALA